MCNLFSLLQDNVERSPEKVFIIDKETKWTYSDIYEKVVVLAEHLRQEGMNKGDRIIIYLDNSAEYAVAYFSILLANGIIVPINKNTTLENTEYIIKDTSPSFIVSNKSYLKRLQGKLDYKACREVDIDSICANNTERKSDFINNLTKEGELPALILYTSGTTRAPKGVTLTHKNLLSNTQGTVEYLGLTSEDSILATVNFCYSYGNSLLLTHTKVGGTMIIENRVSYPIKVIEQLCVSKVSGFSTVGSYINLILKQESLRSHHLKNLRYITFAGESTNFEDIVKLNGMAPDIKIFVMYGQTEAAPRLSYLEPDMLFEKAGSIGRGMPGVTLRVVSDEGKDVIPGEIGEIIAAGDNIMKGYWNNEEDTKSVVRDGWLYTGDLATVDEAGYIFVKGRKDDIIKYMGHRISPVEIEAAINTCEQVLESAVVGVESGEGKLIKAYIVPKSEGLRIEEINTHINKLLPSFKRPQVIELIDDLPRTTSGKIKRSELRKTEVKIF
jgi:acyl-coenzyme A synthetase/AMP-(fatty) acid ligase